MKLFSPLPGWCIEPPGMERRILRAIPAMLALGTMLPAAYVLALHLMALGGAEELLHRAEMARYVATGAILLNLVLVMHAALLAGTVALMKGKACLADAYPLACRPGPRD